MKVLVIGGNRFVGLRLTHLLSTQKDIDLSIVNRTGQAPHAAGAAVYKADRKDLSHSSLDHEWDHIIDFAGFDEGDARSALDYFTKVGRYTFISTLSVYDPGAAVKEEDFNPKFLDLTQPVLGGYQDGKRRAEATLSQFAHFPVVHVRFPLILGPDDYTRRLEFHVERTEQGQPIYFPSIKSRISMIHAQDACQFLHWNLQQTFEGPLNVGAPEPISLADLVQRIEHNLGRKMLLMDSESAQNHSPYGVGQDLYQDVSLAHQRGFTALPIASWIGELIEGARRVPSASSRLH